MGDLDGFVINVWRAIQNDPVGLVGRLDKPPTSVDKVAAGKRLHGDENLVAYLINNPNYYCLEAATDWLYVADLFVNKTQFDGNAFVLKNPTGLHSQNWSTNETRLKLFNQLSDRLKRVRIQCTPWEKLANIAYTGQKPAYFLDPPYHGTENAYQHGTFVSEKINLWCQTKGQEHKIVLAGAGTEHDNLIDYGWTKHNTKPGSAGQYKTNNKLEDTLWVSPQCETQTLW